MTPAGLFLSLVLILIRTTRFPDFGPRQFKTFFRLFVVKHNRIAIAINPSAVKRNIHDGDSQCRNLGFHGLTHRHGLVGSASPGGPAAPRPRLPPRPAANPRSC